MCENQPPTRSTGQSRLFNPRFPGLTLRHRNAVTWTCDWLFWFSFITDLITDLITPDITPFCNFKLEHRVSVFPFSQPLLSLAGCLLPYCASSQSYFNLCFLSVNCRESSSFFGPLASCLAASVVAHWGGNRTVPWPLV
jgi:hypothetical protein